MAAAVEKGTWTATVCVSPEHALGGRLWIRCLYLEHGFEKKTPTYSLPSPTRWSSECAYHTSSISGTWELVEMQMVRPHLRLAEPEPLG